MRDFLRILILAGLFWLPAMAQADTGFSYQGRLEQGGTPFTGSQLLRFRLYDSPGGSIEVAPMVEVDDVEVVDGLFQVDLDFGPGVFDGQPRYIEVEVDEQVLLPRQAVSPSPVALYALSGNEGPPGPEGPPGEQGPQGEPGDSHWSLIDDATYYMDGFVGIGTNDPKYALHVESTSPEKRSIVGVHTGTSGGSFGGWFQSESTSGRGVFGSASAPTGVNFGVVGESHSSSGSGVYGMTSSQTGTNYGVFGQSFSDSGHGVYGVANASSGATYGVRGHVNSPQGYAGYFTGGNNYFQGRVGIGTDDPTARLNVESTFGQVVSIVNHNNSFASGMLVETNGGQGETVRVNANHPQGNYVGLRVTVASPNSHAAYFTGPEGSRNYFQRTVGIGTTSSAAFMLAVDGNAAKPGGGSWSTWSDLRLKQELQSIEPGMLDRLLTLNGYTFEFRDEAIEKRLALPGRQIGLIAQEVAEVFPDWVGEDQDGTLFVTERGVTAIVVEALRELREEKDLQIESLRQEVTELRALVEDVLATQDY